jgi:chemotaxis protein methyltransferase CheR
MPSTAPSTPVATSIEFTPQQFRRFAEFITRELGIKMSEQKIPLLKSRLHRRLRALGLPSVEAYQEHLFGSLEAGHELAEFIDAITTNKTDFLREPSHFDYLVRTVLPPLAQELPGRGGFKLWCAGCSTGEEPYTLAMYLSEFAENNPPFAFSLFATDISTHVLHTAQRAIYDESRVEPVPEDWRRKYLLRSRDPARNLVRIAPELRTYVRFARLNFMDEDYGVNELFDVVFLRNVLIYFSRATQESVVRRLCANLRPGGYLFTGHSESLLGLDLPLRMVASAVYRKFDNGTGP